MTIERDYEDLEGVDPASYGVLPDDGSGTDPTEFGVAQGDLPTPAPEEEKPDGE